MNDLHINGEYKRGPWGYVGMTVRIYRWMRKGTEIANEHVYAMSSLRGRIATARTMDALADLARRNCWVATYRHLDANGREAWVSIPE